MVIQWNSVNKDTKERCHNVHTIQVFGLRGIFLEKLYVIFQCRDKRDLPLYTGIRIEQVSVERGSTVMFINVNEVV